MKSNSCTQINRISDASPVHSGDLPGGDRDISEGETRHPGRTLLSLRHQWTIGLSPRAHQLCSVLSRDSQSPRGDIKGERSVAVLTRGNESPVAPISHQRGALFQEFLGSKGKCIEPRALFGRLTCGERMANPPSLP